MEDDYGSWGWGPCAYCHAELDDGDEHADACPQVTRVYPVAALGSESGVSCAECHAEITDSYVAHVVDRGPGGTLSLAVCVGCHVTLSLEGLDRPA